MRLETKKTIGLIFIALSAMVVVTGIVLFAVLARSEGRALPVSYAFYSLSILAVGLFITWVPKMQNTSWTPVKEAGRLRLRKKVKVTDTHRLRLVFWPAITFSFELFGLFSFCSDAWPSATWEALETVFTVVTVLLLMTFAIWSSRLDRRDAEKNKEGV